MAWLDKLNPLIYIRQAKWLLVEVHMNIYKRTLQEDIEAHLYKGKIIIIYGTRQVGKTTLCRVVGHVWEMLVKKLKLTIQKCLIHIFYLWKIAL